MSTRASTEVPAPEYVESALLEKIESKRAPGELTPTNYASPAMSTDERLDDAKLGDDAKLEEGSPSKHGKPAITHRPTGFRVRFPITRDANLVVGTSHVLVPDRTVLVRARQYYRRRHSACNRERLPISRQDLVARDCVLHGCSGYSVA